ncbi:hypothetical protein HY572_01015 [Candidatus Micrarchaeota archaeon]|nr:hypothetical protein [Candidatus Micrarchaeota archaeon]
MLDEVVDAIHQPNGKMYGLQLTDTEPLKRIKSPFRRPQQAFYYRLDNPTQETLGRIEAALKFWEFKEKFVHQTLPDGTHRYENEESGVGIIYNPTPSNRKHHLVFYVDPHWAKANPTLAEEIRKMREKKAGKRKEEAQRLKEQMRAAQEGRDSAPRRPPQDFLRDQWDQG